MSQDPVLHASVQAILAGLERYERCILRLLQGPWDSRLYAESAARFDAMRAACMAVPQVSREWAFLLVHHFELAHALWQAQAQPDARLRELGGQHLLAIGKLRDACMAIVAPTAGA